jgi:hypothetical protein
MKTNFAITDNYGINFESSLIDLHNNFDFVQYNYKVNEAELILSFRKAIGNWISENEFEQLLLVHRGVSEFLIENENKHYSDSIVDLTFYPTNEKEISNLMLQENATDGDDIIYNFESGQTFRVNCDEIELQVL